MKKCDFAPSSYNLDLLWILAYIVGSCQGLKILDKIASYIVSSDYIMLHCIKFSVN